MRLTVILLMVLAASLASADTQLTATGQTGFGSGELEWEPAREVVLKWSQLPDFEGGGITSEYRTSDDFWSESADDFYCDDGAPVVLIEWWGVDYTSAGVTSFMVRFYSDVPAPPFSHPGDVLYEEMVYSWTAEPVPDHDSYYHYTADLPVAFDQVGENVYWISIQAIHDYEGQWFWLACVESDYWNDEGTIRSDYFGIPDWTPLSQATGGDYYEFAFVLYADVTSPVEDASWGHIKAMFR
jgi:hypothetical protein